MVLTCCLVLALIFMTIQYFKLRANCEGGTGRNVVMLEEELDQVRNELKQLYLSDKCMPLMVRLAWHDAGTYSKWDKSGGAQASIRFQPESDHGANAGLKAALKRLEPIKAKHSTISYADLIQLASVVAIEHAGGPKIAFRSGRKDAPGPMQCTPDGRLPDGTKRQDHLRDIFYRMGFNDAEIVVLSGAHTLGRAHKDRSGFDGAWTANPLVFDRVPLGPIHCCLTTATSLSSSKVRRPDCSSWRPTRCC